MKGRISQIEYFSVKLLITTIFLFLCSSQLQSQQSTIYGIVTLQNSLYKYGEKQYVPNALVTAPSANAQQTSTNIKGEFQLICHVPEKTSITIQVEKDGLQVINIGTYRQ